MANQAKNNGPMFCRRCGYNMYRLSSTKCPECGREFDPSDPSTVRNRPRPRYTISVLILSLISIVLLSGYVMKKYPTWQEEWKADQTRVLVQDLQVGDPRSKVVALIGEPQSEYFNHAKNTTEASWRLYPGREYIRIGEIEILFDKNNNIVRVVLEGNTIASTSTP